MAPKISTAAPLEVGQRFGQYTVIRELPYVRGQRQSRNVLCQCDCGRTKIVEKYKLLAGISYACHVRTENWQGHRRMAKILITMRQRCYNPRSSGYKNYGGRGIVMCEEWRSGFTDFRDWALANGYTDQLTIDRIDNDGPYSPDNCRWVPNSVNARHRRNTNVVDATRLVDKGDK